MNAVVVRPAEAAAQGVKNPDLIVDAVVHEIVAPASGNIERVLDKIVSKHQQAGVVVVDLANTTVTAAELTAQAGRLWGKPGFSDVTKIILIQAGKIAGTLLPPAATGASRVVIQGAATTAAQAARDK